MLSPIAQERGLPGRAVALGRRFFGFPLPPQRRGGQRVGLRRPRPQMECNVFTREAKWLVEAEIKRGAGRRRVAKRRIGADPRVLRRIEDLGVFGGEVAQGAGAGQNLRQRRRRHRYRSARLEHHRTERV